MLVPGVNSGINFMILVWLRTASNPAEINQFRSHIGKTVLLIATVSIMTYLPYHIKLCFFQIELLLQSVMEKFLKLALKQKLL